jgi:hypothetical protein
MWQYSSGHLSTTGRRGLAGYSLRKMLRHLSHAKADQPSQRFFDMASGTFHNGCPGSLGFAMEVATKNQLPPLWQSRACAACEERVNSEEARWSDYRRHFVEREARNSVAARVPR